MINEVSVINKRVSVIKVDVVDPTIVRLFARARPGEIVPQPGIIVHMIGASRFSATRPLEGGGKFTFILEIIDGVLKPAAN